MYDRTVNKIPKNASRTESSADIYCVESVFFLCLWNQSFSRIWLWPFKFALHSNPRCEFLLSANSCQMNVQVIHFLTVWRQKMLHLNKRTRTIYKENKNLFVYFSILPNSAFHRVLMTRFMIYALNNTPHISINQHMQMVAPVIWRIRNKKTGGGRELWSCKHMQTCYVHGGPDVF